MSVSILKQLFKEKTNKGKKNREAMIIQNDLRWDDRTASIEPLRWREVMRQNVSDPTATTPPEDRPCKRSKLRGFIHQSITDTTLSTLVTSQGHPRLNTASVRLVCVGKGGLGRR